MILRCKFCSAAYPLAEYGREIDDDLEERLAFVPLNRL
ncbi:MAG: dual CXXC motif small (seleno)protein [Desulfovibrionaceae bacterium]